MQNTKPVIWYKQFWPWFLLAPLVLTVIVGITMLTLSIKEFDGTVNDNYYKEGLAINQMLQRDKNAEELQMAAHLNIDSVTGEVLLTLSGQLDAWPDRLVVQFVNPTRAAQDHQIQLNQIRDNHYRGQLDKIPNNFWYLDIASPASEHWRIKGGIQFPVDKPIELKAGAH